MTILRILFNVNANTSSNIVKFDLRNLNANETILDAEMFLYFQLSNFSDIYEKSVVIRVYQFEKNTNEAFNESILTENPDIHKLFNVIYISKVRKGWQAFKIKKPINNWLKGELNLGLLITLSSYDDNKLVAILNDTNLGQLRTFAAIKVQKNGKIGGLYSIFMLKVGFFADEQEFNKNNHANDEINVGCEKHHIFVDFKKFGWDKFIITPEGFSTYDCFGTCSSWNNNTINHIKLINMDKRRQICCVPTKYLPFPIMFYDKFGNVAIKNYNNMIADECGCR